MKAIILLLSLAIMSMSFTSCSSSDVNDAKVSVAEKIKETVQKELSQAFDKNQIVVDGVDCTAESIKHSEYIYGKVSDFLRVKSEAKALTSSSGILDTACKFLVDKGFDYLIEQSGDSSMCLKKLGKLGVMNVTGEVCRKIKL